MIYSFSRLNLYDTCPYRFYKKYIERLEEPVSKPLALGKAVHNAIEDKIKGVDHTEAILNGWIETNFHSEVTLDEINELASRAKIYPNKGDTEKRFKLPLDSGENAPMIQGIIDVVERKGRSITDWKTNRAMYSVTDTYQVGLYAWAVSELYGTSEVVGSLQFLRFRKSSSKIFDRFDMENARLWALGLAITIEDKLELYSMVPDKGEKIFPACPSNECRHCPFATDCVSKFSKFI